MNHISAILSSAILPLIRTRIVMVALMLLSCSNHSFSKSTISHLCLHFSDGNCFSYSLNEDLEMSLSDEDLTIRTNSIDMTHPLDKVVQITYGDENDAGLADIRVEESVYIIDGGYILFSNLVEGTIVDCYDINGIIVKSHQVEVSGAYQLQMRDLSPGVYIVKVNNSTFKIATK